MAEPVRPLHEHAFENLRYIRETMERAGSFTSIPGWGGMAIGASAVATAVIAAPRITQPRQWLAVWLADALVAAAIGGVAMFRKGRRAGLTLASPAVRRFFGSYLAPIISAAMLTIVFALHGWFAAMPPTWLLLYGASFVSSGAFSIRVVPVMGVCFMTLGLVAAFVGLSAGNVLLGVGFGGLHLIFGFIIARNYGG
ncbi:MAG: hypothetical protein ACXV5L_00800 [Thermoanaerobaculia bacterium]